MKKQQRHRHYEVQQEQGLRNARVSSIEVKNEIEAKQTEYYRQEPILPHIAEWDGSLCLFVFSNNLADYPLLALLILNLGL